MHIRKPSHWSAIKTIPITIDYIIYVLTLGIVDLQLRHYESSYSLKRLKAKVAKAKLNNNNNK